MDNQNVNYDPIQDARDNKVFGILAYLGILVLVPIFGAKNSPYAKFHANQGLVLFIIEVIWNVVTGIIRAILQAVLGHIIGGLIASIFYLGNLALLALVIIGIVYAAQNETKPLPVIGSITILK